MKYAKKFPNIIPIFDEVEGVIRVSTQRACHICNRITEYLEVNYGVPLCSEECLDRMDRMIGEEIESHLTPVENPEEDDLVWSF